MQDNGETHYVLKLGLKLASQRYKTGVGRAGSRTKVKDKDARYKGRHFELTVRHKEEKGCKTKVQNK